MGQLAPIRLGELRKILEAKERAIDSLRETLSATRRTLEGRIGQAEEALGVRDAELRALQQELVGFKGNRRSMESQLENEVNANRRLQDVATKVESSAKGREKELAATMRQLTEEHAVVSAALRHERGDRERLQFELEECKKRELHADQALRKETELRKETQRKLDKYRRARIRDVETSKARAESGVDVDARLTGELERRLEGEQRSRAASEQWLTAELKTREDMEGLFVVGAVQVHFLPFL
jgi:chromosome segregation ATPase